MNADDAAHLRDRIRRLTRTDEDGCWLWQARVDRYGYGKMSIPKRQTVKAHRVAYGCFVGSIPEGLHVDHTCHDRDRCAGGPSCKHRRCVNPAHLALVTNGENIRRGNTGRNQEGRPPRTDCQNHVRVTTASGFTYCRACARRRNDAWLARKRLANK